MPEHYFTSEPQSSAKVRALNFEFLGKGFVVQVDAGVFSATRLDPGTSLLLKYLESRPETISQALNPEHPQILDLGCGWGPISIAIAAKHPSAQVTAVDVNQRALGSLKRAAKQLGLSSIQVFEPRDVPQSLTFDEIWSNPPIRIGKQALHELLELWLPRLSPEGKAYLVVSKHLGSDSLQAWINLQTGFESQRLSTAKGYRILEVSRSK